MPVGGTDVFDMPKPFDTAWFDPNGCAGNFPKLEVAAGLGVVIVGFCFNSCRGEGRVIEDDMPKDCCVEETGGIAVFPDAPKGGFVDG
jgi:hypothetical protein